MKSTHTSEPFPSHYDALTSGAGWHDVGQRTQIELTGTDRVSFLHNLCTNDIRRLRVGNGCEAFLTNVQGKILGLVHVFCCADSLVVETVPGQAEFLMEHLDRYLIREDVQLIDRTPSWGELLLRGDLTEKRLSELGVTVPRHVLDHVELELDGHPVSLRRLDMGKPTFLISGNSSAVDAVAQQLKSANLVQCDDTAVETVRVEAGWPQFGQDVTDQNLPQEVDRDDRAISFTKGCYLGQETVARIDALGHVNRKLVGVRFFADTVPEVGTPLLIDEKQVGQVTSAVFSPAIDAPLALAYVRRGKNAVGTQLQSGVGRGEVISLPV